MTRDERKQHRWNNRQEQRIIEKNRNLDENISIDREI